MRQGQNLNQRNRTRRALIEGALAVMRRGALPSVAEAAQIAGVSRANAYRYFPDSSSLVAAVLDETVRPHEFEAVAPTLPPDPRVRVERFLDDALAILEAHAPQLRVALRLALQQDADGNPGVVPNVGRGTRLRYLASALEPLRDEVDPQEFSRAIAALALVVGIEAQIVLRDLCALDEEQADDVVRWTCGIIVDAISERARPPAEESDRPA